MTETNSTLPPPPAATPDRRVRRSRDDRKIAGVAGGIAHHFDVDPTLVRLAFVVLALFGGSGLLFYAIAWVIIPSDDEITTGAPVEATTPDPPADADADADMAVPVPFTALPMV